VLHVNSSTWVEWWMDIGGRAVVVQFSTSAIPSVTMEQAVGALLLTTGRTYHIIPDTMTMATRLGPTGIIGP